MRLSLKKVLLPVFVGILIILNMVIWGGKLFRGKNHNIDFITNNDLNSLTLRVKKLKISEFNPIRDGNASLDFNSLNSRLNVLVFFSLDDCPICIYESLYWGEAARMYSPSEVLFFGITNETDRKRLDSFLNSNGISFPVFSDKDSKLKIKVLKLFEKQLAIGIKTPFKVFLNSAREVVYVQTAQKDLEKQKLFPLEVSKIFTGL